MSHFAKALRPPRSFTQAEARRLLDASGQYAEHFQEHMIFSLAIGLGLRLHEIQALNIGDVFTPEGAVRSRLALRIFKGCERTNSTQEVHISRMLAIKMAKLFELNQQSRGSYAPDVPLFATRKRCRISVRHMRRLLKNWLEKAGLDTSLRFHELRHTAVTSFHERTRNVVMAQRFARHADIRTTMRYLHTTDEAMAQALCSQLC